MADMKKSRDDLLGLDELMDLMDSSDEDIIDVEDEYDDETEYSDEDDYEIDDIETEDDQESALQVFGDKVMAIYDVVADNTYRSYTEPAENTLVDNKKSLITIAACSAAFIGIAVLLYFFLTTFNYYTTGVSVDEFIERFNSFETTSDSDIYEIIPSYTDVLIPEDAKLGGKNTIELMDGHVVIEANTRFGKIVDLTVRNVDYPGYDSTIHYFDTSDGSTDYLYYYVCLGKAIAAFQPEIKTVYDATYSAYQLHQYAFIYMLYGQGGVYTVEVGDNTISYHLVDACLTVEPIKKNITSAVWPEWLQPKEKPVDDVVVSDSSAVSDTDVTPSDVQ